MCVTVSVVKSVVKIWPITYELGLLAQSDVLPSSELLHGKNWVVQLPRRWRCWRKHTALLTQGVCSGATTEQLALTSGHKHVW